MKAVLAEPDVAAAGRIVVTANHAAGPQPVEVLDTLQSLGERAVLVPGNADRNWSPSPEAAPAHTRSRGGRALNSAPTSWNC